MVPGSSVAPMDRQIAKRESFETKHGYLAYPRTALSAVGCEHIGIVTGPNVAMTNNQSHRRSFMECAISLPSPATRRQAQKVLHLPPDKAHTMRR